MNALGPRATVVLAFLAVFCLLAAVPRVADAQDLYRSIAVLLPEEESTVFDNDGALAVNVAVAPELQVGSGDRVRILIDGTSVAEDARVSFRFSGVDRGSHTIEAQVIGQDGQVLISSTPVTFQMWHSSALFPNRQRATPSGSNPPPPPPPGPSPSAPGFVYPGRAGGVR